MEEYNHAVIFNCQLKNEQSGETAAGVTLVSDGELKTVFDSLKQRLDIRDNAKMLERIVMECVNVMLQTYPAQA